MHVIMSHKEEYMTPLEGSISIAEGENALLANKPSIHDIEVVSFSAFLLPAYLQSAEA